MCLPRYRRWRWRETKITTTHRLYVRFPPGFSSIVVREYLAARDPTRETIIYEYISRVQCTERERERRRRIILYIRMYKYSNHVLMKSLSPMMANRLKTTTRARLYVRYIIGAFNRICVANNIPIYSQYLYAHAEAMDIKHRSTGESRGAKYPMYQPGFLGFLYSTNLKYIIKVIHMNGWMLTRYFNLISYFYLYHRIIKMKNKKLFR